MGVWESFKSFVAGGVGGMSLTFVGYPLDTAKVKLQTAPVGTYSSMLDCMAKTVRTQGPLGLYKGMGPPLASQPFVFAVYFWGFDQGKILCRNAGMVKEVGVGSSRGEETRGVADRGLAKRVGTLTLPRFFLSFFSTFSRLDSTRLDSTRLVALLTTK